MTSQTPTVPAPARSDPRASVETSMRRVWPEHPSRSVLFRLLFVAVAAVFTVQLAGALVIAGAAWKSAEHQLDERLATILDSRAQLVAAPLWRMQYEHVTAVLKELVGNEAIVSASAYDDLGAVVATANGEEESGPTIVRSHPIAYRDGNILAPAGRLEVEVTRGAIVAAFWQSLAHAIVIALLATVAITVGIFIATQKYIGRPLTLIATAIERSRADGKRHKVEWLSDDEFGAVAKAFNAMQDAADRSEHALHAANRRLDFLALHDELTGLPNRRSFEERLRLAAKAAHGAEALAVHFIDLDDFKGINDTLGHAAGDRLLRHVGERLRACIGNAGFAARFGGDEFVVLQTGVGDETSARRFAERLMEAVGQPCFLNSNAIRTGASIGVALMEGGPAEVVRLLSLADIALYQAKRESRGTISFLTRTARDEHDRRRRMEADIRRALDERQFVLFFQPQVRLDTARSVAVEALVRWQHPVDGLMSPGEFLPLVDELGLSAQLGAWVVEAACGAARRLAERGHADVRVAVNLAGAQLVDHSLVRQLEDNMARLAVPASALEVEITEVALIRDPHNAENILSALRRLGITIALDDFGTGYSSLAYLRRFPIDRIKLDRSFVRELPEFEQTAAIVRAICGLSKALGVELVAEGIEREAEAAFLEREGIATAQGYLYCRPLPLDDICAFLDRERRAVSKAA
jgi:diguanylate cyclase (GGDEF)-like protein